MSRHYSRSTALLFLSAVLSGCVESTAPTTGTLELDIVTTGDDVDANGFLATVGDGSPQRSP
jgi:hypothetical protein